ncbi:MAG: 3-oxoacyl-ACP reductase [Deltaproteobacteria bacterium]|jgi:3-oxoacyl-[acyl-carrier protein] reductase|nr:3-oxoacyl-ACP reductase [Deltaproteobacteria bacterium]MBW2529886.1 3-oxoacyl-ACP reductase [Deltaproteobacteria bacterium]
MSDLLIDLGANPTARQLIGKLGLPIPLPQRLRRAKGPLEERPLHDHTVVVGAGPRAGLGKTLAETLAAAGANPVVVGDEDGAAPYREAGEAYGRPPELVSGEPPEGMRPHALVFDATGFATPADAASIYEFFHPWVRRLRRCGRIVVLSRPEDEQIGMPAAAAQGAVDGFVRSIAKEVGRKGSTANRITVATGAEDRLAGPLRFVLSARSAYVSGQPVAVTATAQAPKAAPWVRSLDGKIALVTGAARGIGKATAHLLAAEGAHVVCLDRPEDDAPLSTVARETGGTVLLCDITAPDAPGIIVDHLQQAGGVDVVVHNAGITRDRTLAKMKAERWEQVMRVNLGAVLDITRALLDGPMRDHGRIICLSSVTGIAGNMGQTNYSASKTGLIGLVRELAPEVADRGITINAIAPGFIQTRLTAAVPMAIREVGRRMNNLSQAGVPQDVAEAITFLAMPSSAGVTGTVLRVCGGNFLGA